MFGTWQETSLQRYSRMFIRACMHRVKLRSCGEQIWKLCKSDGVVSHQKYFIFAYRTSHLWDFLNFCLAFFNKKKESIRFYSLINAFRYFLSFRVFFFFAFSFRHYFSFPWIYMLRKNQIPYDRSLNNIFLVRIAH